MFSKHPLKLITNLKSLGDMRLHIPCQNTPNHPHAQSSSVGMLFGNNYYNDLMSTEKIKIHEGLHITKSKFGWMVNGWTKTKEVSKDENRMLNMTH